MKRITKKMTLGLGALALAFIATACAAPQVDHVVDYQIIGDKTVKYIVVPSEASQAGSMYFDQNVSMEICTLDAETADSSGDTRVEKDCRQSRILRTQEYR